MWMQTVNRTDTERVWINVTNSDSVVISNHHPVFRILSNANTTSVSGNDGANTATATGRAANRGAGVVGLAYEDISIGDVGPVQIYGYHESYAVTVDAGGLTINPGNAIGPSVTVTGLNSSGIKDVHGPFVALDTVTTSTGPTFGNHVFIRCM